MLERISRSINYAIEMLGRSLPGLLLGLLHFNAVLVFLWYLYEFAFEHWEIGKFTNALIILSGLLFAGFAGSIFVKSFRDELTLQPRIIHRARGGLALGLVAAPILAVALIRLLYTGHHQFSSPLLESTETQLERFYATFR